jgi:hypothetical protein
VIIVSGKRARRGNPYEGSDSGSDTEWWTPPSQSSGARDHGSGSHPGVDMPSSSSGGSESPLWSKVWSTPGGTGVPLDPEGAFKPGTTIGNQPPASSGKTKLVSWGPTTKVHFYDKDPFENPLPRPPGRKGYLAKVAAQQSPSPDIEHDVSSSSYFSPSPQSPPKPQSKGFVSNFKTYFRKLGKLNFRPRFQRTADTGA